MEINDNIYIMLQEALTLNHASIIENNDDYILINDEQAEIFYIGLDNVDFDLSTLILKGKEYQSTVGVVSKKDIEIINVGGFKRIIKAYQYSYKGNGFEIDVPYQISLMEDKDYPYLAAHYYRNGDDESYLKEAIKRGMLKAVNDEGEIMGFIGEHPEHALGMLYIEEYYRRQGIGRNLEKALINKFLKEGKIPFDHIIRDNIKSLNLQSSLEGMHLDEGSILWYF